MNTILTDDALIDAIRSAGLRVIGPHKILARAVEAAVLAKLREQEPFGWWHQGETEEESDFHLGDSGAGDDCSQCIPLYTHPAPQQADRQRVPDGYVQERKSAAQLAEELARQMYQQHPTYRGVTPLLWENAPSEVRAEWMQEAMQLLQLKAAPEAPAQASAVDDDYKGWYCAQCQRGVDASEVTFREQHQACGRVITDDRPPKVQASAVDERAAFEAWHLRVFSSRVFCQSTWRGWQARAALAQKGGK